VKNSSILVSVSVVVSNDNEIVAEFVEQTSAVLSEKYEYYELLLVDNGSTDGSDLTVQALQQRIPNVRLIGLLKPYDKQTALAAALDHSIGDYVVIMEMDHDPPDMIPTLITKAISGYDVVIGEQIGDESGFFLDKWLTSLFCRLSSKILGYPLEPRSSYFRVISRQVVNAITCIRNKSRYLKYLNVQVGFRQTYVPYQRIHRRRARHEKNRLFRSIFYAIGMITANSAIPLRLAALVGLFASFLNLLYFGYIFIVTLVKERLVEGWLTSSVMNATMFFFVFLILTVLSEYTAQILEETRDQPLYFIEYETSSTTSIYTDEKLNVV
jgi:glycosyltransferase involved in cell wall biosynthesis